MNTYTDVVGSSASAAATESMALIAAGHEERRVGA